MAYAKFGKVTLKFNRSGSTDHAFTETPFYINADLMSNEPLPGKAFSSVNDRLCDALTDIADMSSQDLYTAEINYNIVLMKGTT